MSGEAFLTLLIFIMLLVRLELMRRNSVLRKLFIKNSRSSIEKLKKKQQYEKIA